MKKSTVEAWVEGYIRAWASNNPKEIGALFTKDAAYYTGPFAEPWRGREAIVREWLARRDEPGEYAFRYEVVGTGTDSGIVRGWTMYRKPAREFSNMWLIRLNAEGRCTEFTEWWVQKKKR